MSRAWFPRIIFKNWHLKPKLYGLVLVNGRTSPFRGGCLLQVSSFFYLEMKWKLLLDKASYETPKLHADGIENVFVNGEVVWAGDSPTMNRPGMFLPGKKFN